MPRLGSELAEIHDDPALQLFVDRARESGVTLSLDGMTGSCLRRLCDRLDRLPLAIELIAHHLNVLSIAEVDELLGERLQAFSDERTQRPVRHQSLKAVLDWSYALLTSEQQALLRSLAVFSGRFDLQDVVAVCAHESQTMESVVEGLRSLVSGSLVIVDRTGDRYRYRMLDTVRTHAFRQLTHEEETGLRRRQLHRLAELARAFDGTVDGAHLLSSLRSRVADVRAVLSFCVHDQASASQGLQLAHDVYLLFEGGHSREYVDWLRMLIDVNDRPSPIVAAAQRRLALVLHQFDRDRATEALDRARRTARFLHDERLLGRVLVTQGGLGVLDGHYREAVRHLGEGLRRAEAAGDREFVAEALLGMAAASYYRGQYRQAQEYASRQEAMTSTDWFHGARRLRLSAWIHLEQGRSQDCRNDGMTLLERSRAIEDNEGAARALEVLAHAAFDSGDFRAAHGWLDQIDWTEQNRDLTRLFRAQLLAPRLSALKERSACRIGNLSEAVSRLEHHRWPRTRVLASLTRGEIGLAVRDIAAATEAFVLAVYGSQELDLPYQLASAIEGLAAVTALSSRRQGARLLGAADAIRTRIDAPVPPFAPWRTPAENALRHLPKNEMVALVADGQARELRDILAHCPPAPRDVARSDADESAHSGTRNDDPI